MPVRTRRPLPAALLPALLVVVLVLAACGGGDSGDGVASLSGDAAAMSEDEGGAGGEEVDPEDAFVEFARCMREHGVDMPDPQPGGGGVVRVGPGPGEGLDPASEEFREADEACRPILEEAMGEMPEPSPEEQAEMRDRMLAFARCMREHGVDMPDPTFGEDGSAMVELGPADEVRGPEDDPDFAEAQEACGDLLGGPGEGGITFEVGS